jgi:GAF domain-containing protein
MTKYGDLLGIREEDSSSSLERLQYKHRFASISRFSQDITSILDPAKLLERFLARAIEITGAQRGYLFLWDEDSRDAPYTRREKRHGRNDPAIFGHVVDKVFRTGESLLQPTQSRRALFEFESIVVLISSRSCACHGP